MRINDSIYGQHQISEPVLLELINSGSLQRLKGISQYGACLIMKNYPFPGFNRFDHSVGTMLVLDRLKASLEEKIAGLIHDISHTAFSHVVDYVLGDMQKEDYQDTIYKDFLQSSQIKDILDKYGFDINQFIDKSNFELLDNEIPHLCADRIDYALREFLLWAKPDLAPKVLTALIVVDKKVVFKKFDIACDFANNFLKLQTLHWGGYDAVNRFYRLSQILKNALEQEIISKDDLFIDDNFVLNKIQQSNKKNLIKDLEEIDQTRPSKKIGIKIKKKFRYVDPKVLIDDEIKKLSEIDKGFVQNLDRHRKLNALGVEI